MKRFTVCLTIFMAMSYFAQAELKWSVKEKKAKVHPLQQKVVFLFPFKNKGDESVTFIRVKPSCGCTSVKLDQQTVAPGESGEMKVILSLKDYEGMVIRKSVVVETSDQPDRKERLFVEANIPQALDFSAKRLLWKTGEPLHVKKVSLKNQSKEPIFIKEVVTSDKRIAVELNTLKKGFDYEVELTPNVDGKKIRSLIRIKTVPPEGFSESREYTIYAYVQ